MTWAQTFEVRVRRRGQGQRGIGSVMVDAATPDVAEVGWGKAAWVSTIGVALLIALVGIAFLVILILSSMRYVLCLILCSTAPMASSRAVYSLSK